MSCLLSAGVTRECGFQFGGLKKVYIGNYSEVTGVTYETDGTVSGITMSGATKFFEFEYELDTAQKLEELQVGAVSRFVNQTLTFKLAHITQAKTKVLEELANAILSAIVQTTDGTYWLFGDPNKSNGLKATVISIDSGTAKGDDATATVTLVGASLGYSDEVNANVITSIK